MSISRRDAIPSAYSFFPPHLKVVPKDFGVSGRYGTVVRSGVDESPRRDSTACVRIMILIGNIGRGMVPFCKTTNGYWKIGIFSKRTFDSDRE